MKTPYWAEYAIARGMPLFRTDPTGVTVPWYRYPQTHDEFELTQGGTLEPQRPMVIKGPPGANFVEDDPYTPLPPGAGGAVRRIPGDDSYVPMPPAPTETQWVGPPPPSRETLERAKAWADAQQQRYAGALANTMEPRVVNVPEQVIAVRAPHKAKASVEDLAPNPHAERRVAALKSSPEPAPVAMMETAPIEPDHRLFERLMRLYQ